MPTRRYQVITEVRHITSRRGLGIWTELGRILGESCGLQQFAHYVFFRPDHASLIVWPFSRAMLRKILVPWPPTGRR